MSLLFISFSEEKPQQSDRRSRPISNYSLFEVQFGEDASFTEEYGDQDEMVPPIQGTFVWTEEYMIWNPDLPWPNVKQSENWVQDWGV